MTLGINQSSWGASGKCSSAVFLSALAYLGLLQLVCLGFTLCHSSFLSSWRENHPKPKVIRDHDPDKSGCTTSCRGDKTDPTFSFTFFLFVSPTLQPTQES